MVLNLGNLVVSHLWEAVGDDQRALDAIERRHTHVGVTGLASARLRAKARLSERLGKREQAIAALRLFVSIREGGRGVSAGSRTGEGPSRKAGVAERRT